MYGLPQRAQGGGAGAPMNLPQQGQQPASVGQPTGLPQRGGPALPQMGRNAPGFMPPGLERQGKTNPVFGGVSPAQGAAAAPAPPGVAPAPGAAAPSGMVPAAPVGAPVMPQADVMPQMTAAPAYGPQVGGLQQGPQIGTMTSPFSQDQLQAALQQPGIPEAPAYEWPDPADYAMMPKVKKGAFGYVAPTGGTYSGSGALSGSFNDRGGIGSDFGNYDPDSIDARDFDGWGGFGESLGFGGGVNDGWSE